MVTGLISVLMASLGAVTARIDRGFDFCTITACGGAT